MKTSGHAINVFKKAENDQPVRYFFLLKLRWSQPFSHQLRFKRGTESESFCTLILPIHGVIQLRTQVQTMAFKSVFS
ncbi:hypothetical protein AT705_01545 [Pseudoalteromonas rubra]|uniref:Uncharacterized protein n=1 Tax=Pseudoalteromonas rubra TaxID=43658 RepID=A0A0U3GF61_9GAMM|nr:hypothetical protein AT705_01545 [Pseudoalteromonas rubra]